MSDFVSLNSWGHPGLTFQAADAVEIVEGGPADWPVLAGVLRKYQAQSESARSGGAAIGYFEYEGGFWFGIYPQIDLLSAQSQNSAWNLRAHLFRPSDATSAPWLAEQTQAEFEDRVRRAQDYICQGDIYQVNLAQRYECAFGGNPYALFEHLLRRSAAPGAAFIDTGSAQILCASPELFLQIDGRRIVTKPIKGTRPRHAEPEQDEQLAADLLTDPKEMAELIMITDLARNDLGRVSEYGSVKVTDLLRLERYPQVFHLVSTVQGRLRAEVDALGAVRACFPGGSVTGAPKRRAMEIISELEGRPRGIYTGAIGYFGFNGDAAFTMAIRTVQLRQKALSYFAGSGITAGSDPRREFEETMHKGLGLRQALESYLEEAASRKGSGGTC